MRNKVTMINSLMKRMTGIRIATFAIMIPFGEGSIFSNLQRIYHVLTNKAMGAFKNGTGRECVVASLLRGRN